MEIIPAILTDNLEELKKQLIIVEEFSDTAQIDIMDGEFVNNISFDKNIKSIGKSIGKSIWIKIEIHLMVQNPLEYIEKWQGIKNIFRIIFHIESNDNPEKVIKKIKSLGLQAGIAINPDTPVEKLKPYLKDIDLVLFMTVVPGKQGGEFLPKIVNKINNLQSLIFNLQLSAKPLIAIDGGVNKNTIKKIKNWGLDIVDIGSGILKQKNPKKEFLELHKIIN